MNIKIKESESSSISCSHRPVLVAQLCLILCDPTNNTHPHQSPLWNSPGKNTGGGIHSILQGIFLIQGSNPHLMWLLHWNAGSLPLASPGTPSSMFVSFTKFASLLISLVSSHGVPVTRMFNLLILSCMSVHFFFTLFIYFYHIVHSFLSKIYQCTNTLSIFI